MKITVDRKRWDRGKGEVGDLVGHGNVFDPTGKKLPHNDPNFYDQNNTFTAFGFAVVSAGPESQKYIDRCLEIHELFMVGRAMQINDDPTITDDSVREQLLKEEFKKYGHEIEFIN